MTDLGRVLLPYQARIYADRSRLRVVEKSRRIGITWAEAARQVMLAARKRSEGGCDCLYLSTSHRLGRRYIAACAEWARELNLAAMALGERMLRRDGQDILAHEIRFASGHRVQALTSNPEAMRGEGGDTIIDEAAHHNDLPELLKAAGAVGDWGGALTVISTHNGRDNPFNELVEDVRAGRRAGALHRVTLDDALADGLYRRMCAMPGRERWSAEGEDLYRASKLTTWGADEEYLVIPSSSGGVYIRMDLIEECSTPAPVVRLELPPEHMHKPEAERDEFIERWCAAELGPLIDALPRDRRVTLGYDFARSCNGDLSVMAPLAERRDLTKVCPWLLEMRGVPFEEQWSIFRTTAKRIKTWGGAAIDGGGNGSWLGEKALTTFGAEQVTVVQLSSGWYSDHIPPFRGAFEELGILVPADVDVRDDLLMFRLNNKGIPTLGDQRRRDSKDRKPRHGDAAIALALAFSRHSVAPPLEGFRRVERYPVTPDEQRDRLHRDRPRRGRGGRNRL